MKLSPPFRPRHGFTIVELLVSIAIIGLLTALILPAVQSSRESARKITCHNTLHQIGLALHNFEERHRTFPMEGGPWIRNPSSGSQGAARYSVLAQLLADLDQPALANQFDFSVYNRQVSEREPRVELFLCPSDPVGVQGTNYRVCTGDRPFNTGDSKHRGMFLSRTPQSCDMTDGMSQTIAFSERIRSDESLDPFQKPADMAGSGLGSILALGQDVTSDEMLETCRSLSGAGVGYSGRVGWFWSHTGDFQTKYNHVGPPNSRVGDCAVASLESAGVPGDVTDSTSGGQMSARSDHPGGVNCLLADGSARFISDSIDLGLWRSLATIAGNEVIGEF